jgi:hypothetical protein
MHSAGSGYGKVVGSCDSSDEPLVSGATVLVSYKNTTYIA